jgi:hypothetical protein
MQDETGKTPNVDYVVAHEKPPAVSTFSADKKYDQFKYLQDMFPLVDPDVYTAVRKMLTTPRNLQGLTLSKENIQEHLKFKSAMIQQVTDLANLSMWDGPPPHCYWIFREVVADLLDAI